ncbi:Hemoglobin, heme-dependent two component system sensory histidine kinase ChrS [Leucobacter sp. 7(1)]|uniref:sensor histidine kinase n=1 Tax=Leucobacter sp. 7(1) TaxID=1255613 RepID=UPI00097EF368|nr:histidine kinase [Leucobacter sp. 7(1)]SJN08326.1 Hemoglobin, heme-dependent two component system sensory histidine kinase ChrS [Leucobacter sp. 7(1)]
MTVPPAEWSRPRAGRAELRVDAGIAAALAFGSVLTALLYARTGVIPDPAPHWVSVLGLAACTLPLAFRRVAPIPVAILVSIGFFVCGQFAVPELLITNVALFLALYTVGAWEPNRAAAVWTLIGTSAALLIWLIVSLIISASDDSDFLGMPRSGLFSAYATFAVIQIITNLLYFGAAYWFGLRSWRAARTQAALEAQGQELERERRTSAEQAVALDRIAIARELHDVVAHHVSVMGIQAGAARRSIPRDPDRAVAALEIVEESARSAVAELQRLVHTLRMPDADAGSSTVGIAQLSGLLAESQDAGVPVTLIVTGDARPVPMLVDVALYRVAQEALTNVRKHAGRGAAATVRLRFLTDAIEVEVSDDGVALRFGGARGGARPGLPSGSRGSGLGLRGMRERLGAVGGTVWAGPRERGGFLVRAHVPLGAATSDASAATPAAETETP